MRRCVGVVSLLAVCGLLLPASASAVGLSFNVNPNREFVVDMTLSGSTQVLLDAAWVKANADLDIVVVCDDLAIGSFSAESKLETLSFGAATEGDLLCLVVVYAFQGSSKGNLSARITGTEQLTSAGTFFEAFGREIPAAAAEAIRKARAAKGRARR